MSNSPQKKNNKKQQKQLKVKQLSQQQNLQQKGPEQVHQQVEKIICRHQTNKGCYCKRTKCLKMYCECFEAGIKCQNYCKCIQCENRQDHQAKREVNQIINNNNKTDLNDQQKKRIKKQMKGCNCKKSGCQKKYCQCFSAQIFCHELCKCQQCKNIINNNIQQNIQQNEQAQEQLSHQLDKLNQKKDFKVIDQQQQVKPLKQQSIKQDEGDNLKIDANKTQQSKEKIKQKIANVLKQVQQQYQQSMLQFMYYLLQ